MKPFEAINSNSKYKFAAWAALGLFLLGTIVLGGGILSSGPKALEKRLKVKYFLSELWASNDLFDPTNHETIHSYYLAENLGIGLLRDDTAEPSGYRPLLAENWKWDGDRVWQFKIRKDLRWSDGTSIGIDEILKHLNRLCSENYRHLRELKKVEKIELQGDDLIILTFKEKMSEKVLHELSLADSILIKRDADGKPNWSITSGPYYVGSFKPKEELLLKANAHSVIFSNDYPTEVLLVTFLPTVPEGATPPKLKLDGFDVARVPTPIFSENSQSLIESSPRIKEGASSGIYFFKFNKGHPLTTSLNARKKFRDLIYNYFETLNFPKGVAFERQMIPQSYNGRLVNLAPEKRQLGTQVLKGQLLKIVVPKRFQQLSPSIISDLISTFKLHDVNLEFIESNSNYFEPPSDFFARLTPFAGNQSDASGTWNFHLAKGGALTPFINEINDRFFSQSQPKEAQNNKDLYLHLHQHVLDQAYLIPLLIEQTAAVHSERVNLDRWNPFDMRMRFYEVRWVQ
jgi:MarR-like DNA-binding transcriptional regulator SgrR of sgrS sRNA